MTRFRIIPFLSVLFLSLAAYPLVDYSDASSSQDAEAVQAQTPISPVKSSTSTGPSSRSSAVSRKQMDFSLDLTYESTRLTGENIDGKIQKGIITGHFQTAYNFYIDASYWYASGKTQADASPK